MIKKENFPQLLEKLNFIKKDNIYIKKFPDLKTELIVDFKKQELIYPEKDGFRVNERQTCNFKQAENFVVFESVHRLLNEGYSPKHIELEPKWQLGHGASGGRADILVKDNSENTLLIIECKRAGVEFTKAWNSTQIKPTQLFSYVQQEKSTKFIALYTSDLVDGKIKADYYLINLSDNKKLLENNKELKSYNDANSVEEIYEVWSKTYQKDYATIGLFEDTQAYNIGKDKYALKDLKIVTSRDIQGKYHEFATIMRQHNVSGRENAFDKLVNLFLCKVVDEANNPNELKFYWKGVAYDDPFSLQDRLNHLYKVGMKQFLGENITYIENSQIDDAFSVFKDKPNMTKEIIQGFFKELKFFTNNDFAFVDVHNEELFYQNFEVLLKVVKMLQDIKLTGGESNQFLGDMFEGFLDQGVKQSEGQFFTPMPIVKFIINSLPLDKIKEPKAIDYACGAGHFLNEIANNFPKEYHKNIVGIEKEYRLSKVAKVSSFMYGQDDVKVVYHDALSPYKDIRDNNYSILVANPPYSVKGFLETLKPKDRANYELIKSLDKKSFITNNAIECFFIERAKQLLKKDALAGIILPSSILSKGSKTNIYVHTREILLRYFKIVAIAEFGSGTFGKTGTNTVTLFLKRRPDNPDMQKHLKYMVNSWFDGNFSSNELFKDNNLLYNYCKHIEIDLEEYKKLLKNEYNKKLFENEMFNEYNEEFQKLSETKKRKKQKYYKNLTIKDKEKLETEELLKYVRVIEEDKLYYFSLAYLNKKEVLIIKSPSDGAKNKKFLGYEWSGRKGDEGIKYITSKRVKLEEGAEALENILNQNNIQTPLYNPQDKYDESKINSLIAKNFNDEVVEIPKGLEEFVSKARLVDMLDFSRKDFSKVIGLSTNRKINIESKYKVYTLDKLMNIVRGASPRPISKFITKDSNGVNWIKIGDVSIDSKYVTKTKEKITIEGAMKSRKVKHGDFILSNSMSYGRPYIVDIEGCVHDGWLLLSNFNKDLDKHYLYEILSNNFVQKQFDIVATGTTVDNLNVERVSGVKIPLPPLQIQKEIIEKCEIIDNEVNKANIEILDCKNKIEKEIEQVLNNNYQTKRLKEISIINPSKTELKDLNENTIVSFIEMASVSNNGFIENKIDKPYKDFKKGSFKYFIENDIIIAKITPSMENGKCAIATNLKNKIGMGSSEFHVIRVLKEINELFLFILLNRDFIRKDASKYMTGSSGHRRVPASYYENMNIPIPNLNIQKEIVQKIQILEAKIIKAKTIIEDASSRKEAILMEYL